MFCQTIFLLIIAAHFIFRDLGLLQSRLSTLDVHEIHHSDNRTIEYFRTFDPIVHESISDENKLTYHDPVDQRR